jgi:hypothetical protein
LCTLDLVKSEVTKNIYSDSINIAKNVRMQVVLLLLESSGAGTTNTGTNSTEITNNSEGLYN